MTPRERIAARDSYREDAEKWRSSAGANEKDFAELMESYQAASKERETLQRENAALKAELRELAPHIRDEAESPMSGPWWKERAAAFDQLGVPDER